MSRYDVTVVGGGINGAGIAQAVAAAGHSVLVLEKTALASGTSHRSSKLVHGGLRYLESAQLSMVRESLHQRRLLLKLAPDLVRLRRFYLPVFPATRRRPWQLFLGLTLYALLAGFHRETRFKRLPRRQWDQLDGLRTGGLQAVFSYFDGQTDDAALVRAVMRSARDLGAELAVPAELYRAERHSDGCTVHYRQGERSCTVQCAVLVNAAGPWAAELVRRIEPSLPPPNVDLVQGAHVLIPGTLQHGIYYVESPRDGRAIFVMPRPEGILVGTTEKIYRGDPDDAHASTAEKHYLFTVLKHYFPRFRDLDYSDIVHTTAGLRVLPTGPRHAFHRSREVMLSTDRNHKPCVVSVFGGKLTTFRATAAKVLRRMAGSLPQRRPVADTARLSLVPD